MSLEPRMTLSPRLALLALLTLPAAAFAQSSSPTREQWTLGIGAAAIDSPYAGEGTRVRPFPLIGYEGERVFLRGISGGVHVYESGGFTVDAILSPRLHGFDISDLGQTELRANGVDPALLSDRDDGLDAGVRLGYGGTWGAISFDAVHDVTGTSEGYELALDYRYTWLLPRGALTANLGTSWMSDDLAGYYFGTLDEEVARGVTAYAPGSAAVPRIGLTATVPLGNTKWQLLGSVEVQFLPDALRDSPLLDADSERAGRFVLGLSRRL